MRIAMRLDLRHALVFLVHANGEELDHRLGHAQTALDLGDQRSRSLDDQQNVKAIIELLDRIGQPAAAHLLGRLHRAATRGDIAGERLDELVELSLFNIGPNDKHDFVSAIHLYFFLRGSAPHRFGWNFHPKSVWKIVTAIDKKLRALL